MARRRRQRKRKGKKPRRASLSTLLQRGRDAWRHGREADALRLWGRAWEKKPSPELAAALGELHFRRGVRDVATHLPNDDTFLSGMADLERAEELLSGDERPPYYLGLVHHRLDNPQEAQAFYLRALELRPDHRRAAYHLALAALEQESDPAQSQGWTLLTADQQADFQAAWHLLNKQSKHLRSADDIHPLWIALAALDSWRADKRRARESLDQVLAQEDDDTPRSRLARIYLGNLLWSEDPLTAARHWDSATRGSTEYQVFPTPPWTKHNRAVGAGLLACQTLEDTSDFHTAFPYARIALDYAPDQRPYQEVMAHIHLLFGSEAAGKEQWDKAVDHWEEVRHLAGESYVLFHNLALGYEHLERWKDAAEAWREYLRRLPRRETAPGTLTLAQEGRVRRHVASLYLRTGNKRAAFRFYDQALDAYSMDKDGTALRLEFVELLAHYGQWRRAERVLRQGLKRHPDHPDLLQALGLLYERRGRGKKALAIWEQALRSSPDNPLARGQMAAHLARQGDSKVRRERINEAIVLYERALEYAPQDGDIRFDLADLYHRSHRTGEAVRLMDEMLEQNPNTPTLLSAVIHFWLTKGEEERADSLLQWASGWDSKRQATLYALVGTEYYQVNQPRQGERLLRRALQTGHIPAPVVIPAAILLLHEEEYRLAIQLLTQALQLEPDELMVSLLLALVHTFQGEHKRARSIISKARHIARRNKDLESAFMLRELSQMMRRDPYGVLMMLDAIVSDEQL